ncbi:MAG: Ldh family oxidoreductase [Anaerolineae bacterium]|nr:Ldh family oxidoreductase [Anaerolineae bacterium]
MSDALVYVAQNEIYRFVYQALIAAGVREEVAELTAKGLWSTSLRGVDSHGVRLLVHYVHELRGGVVNPNPNFVWQQTAASTGTLDADHSFGHASGMIAMRHAIELAQEAGTGFVSVRNSTHCGAMAYFGLEAAAHDMIGLAFTHATPKVQSPGATQPFFGTNPICVAAPMQNEAPFSFDSAISQFSFNKVHQYREDGLPLPENIASDENGQMTTDAHAAFQLLPIGIYKGFGMAMMVDMFSGLLSGMPTGDDVSSMFDGNFSHRRFIGHFFGAFKISAFIDVDDFKQQLQMNADKIRKQARLDENIPVMVPGDPQKITEAQRRKDGIPVKPFDIERFQTLASELGIEPLNTSSN